MIMEYNKMKMKFFKQTKTKLILSFLSRIIRFPLKKVFLSTRSVLRRLSSFILSQYSSFSNSIFCKNFDCDFVWFSMFSIQFLEILSPTRSNLLHIQRSERTLRVHQTLMERKPITKIE